MGSRSATCAATIVVEQISFGAKSVLGLMVQVVGPPVTTVLAKVTFRGPLVGQLTWNQSPVTATGSLKVMVRLLFVVTPVAPLVGMVLVTVGAVSTGGGPPPPESFGEQATYTPPLKLAPKAGKEPRGGGMRRPTRRRTPVPRAKRPVLDPR